MSDPLSKQATASEIAGAVMSGKVKAVSVVEAALTRIMGQLEILCTKDNADELVSTLLKKFDVVTGLSAWSDPQHSH